VVPLLLVGKLFFDNFPTKTRLPSASPLQYSMWLASITTTVLHLFIQVIAHEKTTINLYATQLVENGRLLENSVPFRQGVSRKGRAVLHGPM
jgi:hypothetical protein